MLSGLWHLVQQNQQDLKQKPSHIAVFRLSAMGDVAMIVPVLRAVLTQNPNLKITVVSRAFFEPFFQNIPNLHFFAFQPQHKGFFGLFRLFWQLKNLKINCFADLHNVIRSKIVCTLFAITGTKTATIDKNRAQKKALTRPFHKIFKPLTTVFEQQCKVFEKLGYSLDLSHPVFPPKAILNADLQAFSNNNNNHLIGVAPFAQHQGKVYPADLMQQVIEDLARQKTNKILLFGAGKNEETQLASFAKNHTNVTVIAGKLTLTQELQLISNLDVMLSMDSANAHIAAMLGTKVITLWGATHPYAGFLPFAQPIENALVSNRKIYPKLPTSIYGNKKVLDYDDAMRSINPLDIVLKIKQVLS